MLNWYKETLDVAEMQVSLARSGYEKKIAELADALNGVSIEEAEELIDEIKFAKKALSDLEVSRDNAKRRYQEECEAREGGNK